MKPELTILALHDLSSIVVAHGSGITGIGVERLDSVTVIAIQTIHRSHPHITSRVAVDAVHLRIRQPIANIQTTELDIRNDSLDA